MITFVVESILKNRDNPVDIHELAKIYGLSLERLLFLLRNLEGIVFDEEKVRVVDPVKLTLSAYKKGADIKLLSRHLSWKDFEETAAMVFREAGYTVFKNYRFSGEKRGEVDVIAVDEDCRVFAVDCKHWSPKTASPGSLKRVTEHAIDRSYILSRNKVFSRIICQRCSRKRTNPAIYTLIITLYRKGYGFMKGAAIIPISLLSDFLASYYTFIDELIGIDIKCPQESEKEQRI
jgi:Holliday junction resolvase-like predicted endonuclease